MHAMLRHFHLDPARCVQLQGMGEEGWRIQPRLDPRSAAYCSALPTSGAAPRSVDALLTSTQDLVAGGAALHAWLGEPLASFSGDLDVFCGEDSWARWRQLLEASTAGFICEQSQAAAAVALGLLLAGGSLLATPACASLCCRARATPTAPLSARGRPLCPTSAQSCRRAPLGGVPASAWAAPPGALRSTHACSACLPARPQEKRVLLNPPGEEYQVEVNGIVQAGRELGRGGGAGDEWAHGTNALAVPLTPPQCLYTPTPIGPNSSPPTPGTPTPAPPQVLDFVRGQGAAQRKVQVVVCLLPDKAPAGFDLSAAATSWNGRTLDNPFPWLTRRYLMFWQWEVRGVLCMAGRRAGGPHGSQGAARSACAWPGAAATRRVRPPDLGAARACRPCPAQDRPVGRTRLPARRKKYEAKGFTLLVRARPVAAGEPVAALSACSPATCELGRTGATCSKCCVSALRPSAPCAALCCSPTAASMWTSPMIPRMPGAKPVCL